MQSIRAFLQYLFDTTPGPVFNYYWLLIGLAIALLLASLGFSVWYKKKKREDIAFKRAFRKLSGFLMLFGLLFLLLAGLRYENIPIFSMRFWLYLSLLGLAYLIYRYVRIFTKEYPDEKKFHARHAVTKTPEKQYLPHKKKY